MAGRKFSGIEYDQRIDAIIKQTVKGVTGYTDLKNWIVANYDISDQQAYKDIKTSRERIREMLHEDIKSEVEDAVLRYKTMLENAVINMADSEEQKDRRGWATEFRNLQNDLSKLLGLDAAQKVDVTSLGDKIQISNLKIETSPSDGESDDVE